MKKLIHSFFKPNTSQNHPSSEKNKSLLPSIQENESEISTKKTKTNFLDYYLNNSSINQGKKEFSKIGISFTKEDILQENEIIQKNINFNKGLILNKKLKRKGRKKKFNLIINFQTIPKARKIHDRKSKDNIVRKIQVHYITFLTDLVNEVIKKIITKECVVNNDYSEYFILKNFFFNYIDYSFKSKVNKSFIEELEGFSIRDILSPSEYICDKFNVKNYNAKILKNVLNKRNLSIENLLNKKYLEFFSSVYFLNLKSVVIIGDSYELSKDVKTFDNLLKKVEKYNDESYLNKIKKIAVKNFIKPKLCFKINQ